MYVDIRVVDGSFRAYRAQSAQTPAPGLVLLHYICGVNQPTRRTADWFAAQGFDVLVPDLFWRQAPGLELNNDPANPDPAQTARAMALNQGFDDAAAMRDVQAAITHLRGSSSCNGFVAVLGYCLGGRLAYLSAGQTDADVNVAYYGVNIRKYLGVTSAALRPLLLHFAGNDPHVPEDERLETVRVLSPNPNVAMAVHGGAGHQFALPHSPSFNAAAAQRADRLSLDFIRSHAASPSGQRALLGTA
ncbi:MAG: dienelactone hydrolase family protein [Rhizobiales bacterium]|nr:dienelactone hydrolase family protein [Hyphomicrobiales bacterium]OJY47002.1 MAG: hypothetical protein BGP08_03030 [Rhizobiales bacterium 64-17]